MYADTGVSRRITLLRRLISARLDDFDCMNEYVNFVIDTAHKLNGSGLKIGDDWIGSLLLAGLSTPKYTPMIMAIEHSGIEISSDAIKTKLLDDDSEISGASGGNTLASKRFKPWKKRELKCFECSEVGHKRSQCPRLKSASKSNSDGSRNQKDATNAAKKVHAFSAVFLTGNFSKDDWYVDSGATSHLSVNVDWLLEKNDVNNSYITVANNSSVPIQCSGDIEMCTEIEGEMKDIKIHDVMLSCAATINEFAIG